MSLNGYRAAVAAALSAVDGVVGYTKRPSAPTTGDAWALLGSLEREPGDPTFIIEWRILIVLPSDETAANDWIDDHIEALADALQPLATVYQFTPVQLAPNDSGSRALQISIRSE